MLETTTLFYRNVTRISVFFSRDRICKEFCPKAPMKKHEPHVSWGIRYLQSKLRSELDHIKSFEVRSKKGWTKVGVSSNIYPVDFYHWFHQSWVGIPMYLGEARHSAVLLLPWSLHHSSLSTPVQRYYPKSTALGRLVCGAEGERPVVVIYG